MVKASLHLHEAMCDLLHIPAGCVAGLWLHGCRSAIHSSGVHCRVFDLAQFNNELGKDYGGTGREETGETIDSTTVWVFDVCVEEHRVCSSHGTRQASKQASYHASRDVAGPDSGLHEQSVSKQSADMVSVQACKMQHN